jgi:hypothetical protein
MVSMRVRFLLFFLLILGWSGPKAFAQYELIELGGRAGIGTNVPIGIAGVESSDLRMSWAYNIDGFYSHYFCGKAYGIHGEMGIRGYGLTEERGGLGPSLQAADTGGTYNYNMHYGSVGFYFKFRKNNFHLPKEFSIHIGPKVNFRLISQSTDDGGDTDSFGPSRRDYRQVPTVVPGAHISGWWRFPAPKRRSWFIAAGVEAFATNVSTTADLGYASIYPFVNIGYTFYNNL